jgi:hypothetical protein
MRPPLVLGCGLLLGLLPGAAGAQRTRWDRQVDSALGRAAAILAPQGFAPVGWGRSGVLIMASADSLMVHLAAGGPYLLVGSCDQDCTRLELAVSRSGHYDVGADRDNGTVPLVRIDSVPPGGADYRVRVRMGACWVSPCWWGVEVFEGGRVPRREGTATGGREAAEQESSRREGDRYFPTLPPSRPVILPPQDLPALLPSRRSTLPPRVHV